MRGGGCHHDDLLDSPEVDVDLVSAQFRGPALYKEQGPDSPVEPDQGGASHCVRDHLRADGDTPGHTAHSEARVIKPEVINIDCDQQGQG